MNTIIRRRTMMGKSGGSILPSGYTKLTWLTNGGGAWFGTGVQRTDATSQLIDIECDIIISTNSNNGFMGSDNGNFFGIANLKWDNAGQIEGDITLNQLYHVLMYRDNINTQTFYVDGSLVSTRSRTLSGTKQVYVFNIFNSSAYQIKGSLGRTKIWKARELVRDFVPCIDPNNVYGMYDLVGEQFYSSMTSTPFTGS